MKLKHLFVKDVPEDANVFNRYITYPVLSAFRLALWGVIGTLATSSFFLSLGFKPADKIVVKEQEAEAYVREFGKLTPELMKIIKQEAKARGINYHLAVALIKQESGGDPWVGSSAGAIGLMQVMPETAKRECRVKRPQELFDTMINIKCGLTVLANRLKDYKGDTILALAGYNGSPKCQPRCRRAGSETVCSWPCRESYEYAHAVLSYLGKIEEEDSK